MLDHRGSASQAAYEALDQLIEAVGTLPLREIQNRPNLYQAQVRALEVIDRAVKEGWYAVVPKQD